MIGELQLGKPNYELMSADLAQATRQQLSQIHAELAPLGALEALTFKGVGPGGADIYTVKLSTVRWSTGSGSPRMGRLKASIAGLRRRRRIALLRSRSST